MTTSAGVTFAVRPPLDFSEICRPEEWLEAYRYTRDLSSLLGLLHGGAEFTDDLRVLDVYLNYCSLAEENTNTVEFQVKKKARSVFYHEILKRFHCSDYNSPVRWHREALRNFCLVRAESLSRIFSFFDDSHAFPLEQPFANDVVNFMSCYARNLPILMSYVQEDKVPQDPLYKILQQVVQALVAALSSFRWGGQFGSCEGGDIGYYEALIRRVAEYEFARELVMRVLRKSLQETLGVPGHDRDLLWSVGVEHGGVARRLGLLLYDVEKLSATPQTS